MGGREKWTLQLVLLCDDCITSLKDGSQVSLWSWFSYSQSTELKRLSCCSSSLNSDSPRLS